MLAGSTFMYVGMYVSMNCMYYLLYFTVPYIRMSVMSVVSVEADGAAMTWGRSYADGVGTTS